MIQFNTREGSNQIYTCSFLTKGTFYEQVWIDQSQRYTSDCLRLEAYTLIKKTDIFHVLR